MISPTKTFTNPEASKIRLRTIVLICLYIALAVLLMGATYCGPTITGIAGAVGGQSPPAPAPSAVKLMLFGGANHTVYLGCLSCSEYASDSVRNQYGTHGSAYASESIFNHYGQPIFIGERVQ